jgi:hypothetical protein
MTTRKPRRKATRKPARKPRRYVVGALCFLAGVVLALPLATILRPASTTQAAPVVKARAVQPAAHPYQGATVCRMDSPAHVACDNGYSGPPPRG